MVNKTEYENKVMEENNKIDVSVIKNEVNRILESGDNKDEISNNEYEVKQEEGRGWKEKVLEAHPNLSEFEKEQVNNGWNPDGDKSADEWAKFQSLYDGLKKKGKELKQAQKRIKEQDERLLRIEQEAYERAKQELLYTKDQAIKSNDINTINETEKKLHSLKAPISIPEPVSQFMDKHSEWLNGDEGIHLEMQLYTSQMDTALAKKNYSPEEHMKKLENIITTKFPEYFKNNKIEEESDEDYSPRKTAINNDEGASVIDKSNNKSKFDLRNLTEEQRDVLKYIERHKVMSKEDYLKGLNG